MADQVEYDAVAGAITRLFIAELPDAPATLAADCAQMAVDTLEARGWRTPDLVDMRQPTSVIMAKAYP